eukprot:2616359-Pyramimonas_sp.AAC.1
MENGWLSRSSSRLSSARILLTKIQASPGRMADMFRKVALASTPRSAHIRLNRLQPGKEWYR